MTARELWPLFASLPIVAKAWLVLLAVVVLAGVWTLSTAAGRCAGRVVGRRDRHIRPPDDRAETALRVEQRDRRINAVRRAPQAYIDQVLMARQVELAGDDLEEADQR